MSYPVATVTPSGMTWAQFQQNGFQGLLEALITQNASPTLAPTAAVTLSQTGSGGSLVAGTWYVVATETDAWGETTVGPVSAGQAISGTQELVITPPALKTGNIARNYYWGTTNVPTAMTLLATGQTGSTTTILAPPPTNSYAVKPPTANTTGLTYLAASGAEMNKALELIRNMEKVAGSPTLDFLRSIVRDFLGGQPVPFSAFMTKFNHVRGTVALLNQAMNEMGTLVDANPGTLKMSTPVGNRVYPEPVRVWP